MPTDAINTNISIYAYTESGPSPGYVSINEQDNDGTPVWRISMRGPRANNTVGVTSVLDLPYEQLTQMRDDLTAYLDANPQKELPLPLIKGGVIDSASADTNEA